MSKDNELTLLNSTISKFFNVVESSRNDQFIDYVVTSAKGDINTLFDSLYDELVFRGYYPMLYRVRDLTILRVLISGKRRSSLTRPSIVFFGLTLISVMFTGFYVSTDFYNRLGLLLGYGVKINIIYDMIFFTLSVLVPLTMHELGHLIIVRKTNIPSSYPLLIPAPFISPLGTFGAIVKMDFLPKNLVCLLRLGISGPLLGFITSLILFIITYSLSPRLPPDIALIGLREGLITYIEFMPLSAYLVVMLFNEFSITEFVTLLSPAAYASMIMLLIHFANLLPIGQLDGGHIVRGILNVKTHFIVSVTAVSFLILYSLISVVYFQGSMVWLGIFAMLALLISGFRPHIGSANIVSSDSISRNIKAKYVITYLILLTLVTPLPV